ncbi:MAG: GspE/PulE family protein [Phycisphaerales bacterium]|nr:GspE/PulE family protein [Phycisphaerales bacterium]
MAENHSITESTELPNTVQNEPLANSNDTASLRKRCETFGIDWTEESLEPSIDAIALISADIAVRLRVVPLAILDDGRLRVAMLDPLDITALDELTALVSRPIIRLGMDDKDFAELMRAHYGTTAARIAESLADEDGDRDSMLDHNLDAIEADDLHRMAEQPTLVNLVNLLLLEAVQSRASDVHVEPFENELKVKYRVDGVLVEKPPPPKNLQPAIIGRIKIMSSMNIAERYVPQDGHITLRFEGRKVDIRVSTVPTLYGESVVMRILDKSTQSLDLRALGMGDDLMDTVDHLIAKPHGLVLVTGPTGSGKTTTLYAALTKLYDPRKKIITIEDPVEYELAGINQMPVNPKRGLSFATGLRAILRQDPEVIFVGEIRDGETADIAIRSALTGHLIFSTIHTNDAISSIGRLVDMGAEPYLVASVIEGLLAQRLGRKLCLHCAVKVPMPEEIQHRLTPEELSRFNGMSHQPVGCDECGNSGFYGRIGFFEVITISGTLRRAIADNKQTAELRKHLGENFVPMREDGIRRAIEGVTTVEEVLRATQDTEDI